MRHFKKRDAVFKETLRIFLGREGFLPRVDESKKWHYRKQEDYTQEVCNEMTLYPESILIFVSKRINRAHFSRPIHHNEFLYLTLNSEESHFVAEECVNQRKKR